MNSLRKDLEIQSLSGSRRPEARAKPVRSMSVRSINEYAWKGTPYAVMAGSTVGDAVQVSCDDPLVVC